MEALALGFSLGLWAGVNPGPLTLLVIRQALTHGAGAAALASLAPLLTDSFAIVLAFLVARSLPPGLERALEAVGGAFLVYLGCKGLRRSGPVGGRGTALNGLRDAVVVNLTNPHMYLFWFAVGAGQLKRPLPEPLWFVLGFYPAIVGSKALIGLLIARYRHLPWLAPLARWSNALLVALGGYLLVVAARA
ncbi:homoserine/Threonine efflux protein [Calidithermus terrae]|uniref:Homoserine/Threonine efflux protein n=1 Tax=Calidithermus terrae TaxID=1408545 RepID=A0A399ENU9_9DEIN|nr:LysE family transporter [Calidithermus terrae]RIH83821.1 homoserine/Threonine efflux protein [Calidithermus terrae]